jgi:hypothetical protein
MTTSIHARETTRTTYKELPPRTVDREVGRSSRQRTIRGLEQSYTHDIYKRTTISIKVKNTYLPKLRKLTVVDREVGIQQETLEMAFLLHI